MKKLLGIKYRWSIASKVAGNESRMKTQKIIFIDQVQALWITLVEETSESYW